MIIVLHCHNNETYYVSNWDYSSSLNHTFRLTQDINYSMPIDAEHHELIEEWFDRELLEDLLNASSPIDFGIGYVAAIEFRETTIIRL